MRAFLFLLFLFDALATGYGLSVGFMEGNPIVRHFIELYGASEALLGLFLAKCFLLLVVEWPLPVAVGIAAAHVVFSLIPWTLMLTWHALS